MRTVMVSSKATSPATFNMQPLMYTALPAQENNATRYPTSAGNGHAFTGTRWEAHGHWADDSTRLHTDVFYVLAPGGATSNP